MSRRVRNVYRLAPGAWVVAAVVLASGRGAPALADNAFPASQSVLLPADQPRDIVVGTTFGLVFSEDDGATWAYVCEQQDVTLAGRQYRMGPAPEHRLFAVSDLGAPMSGDGACSWSLPKGPLASLLVLDVWPDPSLPMRAFVLALDADNQVVSAFRSGDGGVTYQGPIFVAPDDVTLTGIESAAANSDVVYMTAQRRSDSHPLLWRSDDGGDTWMATDIEPGVGAVTPRLVAVDPVEPDKVVLLLLGATADGTEFQSLAITEDAGGTWRTPLKLEQGTLGGFTHLTDGTLLAVGTISVARTSAADASDAPPVPTLFRSDDAGRTFVSEALPFHAVGLAQRNGVVFAAANNFQDGFALASSADGGRSWMPRLRFRDITSVKACVRAACQQDCDYQAGIKLFAPETCNPLPDAAVDGPEPPGGGGDGCGCEMAGAPRCSLAWLAPVVVFATVVRRRRRVAPVQGERIPRGRSGTRNAVG